MKLEIGQRGWLAYCGHAIHVEFVGFDAYEPDYPSEPTRYYRALERVGLSWKDIEIGNIFDQTGEHDEVLYDAREAALVEVEKERQAALERKRKELSDLERRIAS